MIVTVFLSLLVCQAQLQLIELNPATFDVVVPEVKSQLSSRLREDFTNVREVVAALDEAFTECTDIIKNQLFDNCSDCVVEKCQSRATQVCSSDGDPVDPVAALVQEDFGCQLSPVACTLITVGNKANDVLQKAGALVGGTVKKVIKRGTKGVKKILSTIRFPRIRLPRIRLRGLADIRQLRIPPTQNRARSRLPPLRFSRRRVFKRKRRQTTEPTCKELEDNPETACQFYAAECPSCAGVTGADELQLIEINCGPEYKEVFTYLKSQGNRLARLEEIYSISGPNIFSIDTIRYDPSKYNAAALSYPNVHVNYTLLGSPTTLLLTHPVNLLDPVSTIVNITQLLYDELLKFTLT